MVHLNMGQRKLYILRKIVDGFYQNVDHYVRTNNVLFEEGDREHTCYSFYQD